MTQDEYDSRAKAWAEREGLRVRASQWEWWAAGDRMEANQTHDRVKRDALNSAAMRAERKADEARAALAAYDAAHA